MVTGDRCCLLLLLLPPQLEEPDGEGELPE